MPFNKEIGQWLAVLVLLAGFNYIVLFTVRDDFYSILIGYGLAFTGFALSVKFPLKNFKQILVLGLLFRCLFLAYSPQLSDDYFRFYWDGKQVLENVNPYLNTPEQIYEEGVDQVAYDGLNSKPYFSVYPPINQYLFAAGVFIGGGSVEGSVFGLRLVMLFFDVLTILLLWKVFQRLKIPISRLGIYVFNPLVITELIGNLHFEGTMLFFALLSFFLWHKKQLLASGAAIGLAISIKLIPLLVFPFVLKQIGFKNALLWGLAALGTIVLTGFPLFDIQLIDNFMSSIDLYFHTFEFNASFYYLFREIGFWIKGYNTIGIIGSSTPVFLLLFGLLLAIQNRWLKGNEGFAYKILLMFTVYYLMATTVHPWYIVLVFFIGVFTKLKYPIIWSGCAVLSYAFYHQNTFEEYPIILFLEYGVILTVLIFEFSRLKLRAND